ITRSDPSILCCGCGKRLKRWGSQQVDRRSLAGRTTTMINLVKNALRRPYTMAIAAMLIMLMGFISVSRMIVDIFPTIDIPVVYGAWSFNGLNAEDMERRVVLVSERPYSTTVNGIDHIESLSIPGQGILKIYFQPGADIGSAIAQISAQSNAVLRIAPPGMQPPHHITLNH